MAYLAIARRWRPHKFEDLVGQGHVVQTLTNAMLTQRVSHAYLLSGARGVGKTSVARIFAKALRCQTAKAGIPCNECAECVAIAESRSVDVAEIDGASHNGVEAVRSIRDNVAYSASTGFYKIYIIDEAHMLSLSAFNALLKTLEEPPAHVLFILATTESQKIPLTILSRCQCFEFRRLTQSQIVDRLKQILEVEKVNISESGLRTLASHADGSLRDALSLLDQVLSYESNQTQVSEDQIVSALGISPTSSVTGFWAAVLSKDIPGLLALLGNTYSAGVDLKHFAERCLEELRLLYLLVLSRETKTPVSEEALDIAKTHLQELERLAAQTNRPTVERMAQILNHAVGQLAWASMPRFVLEMSAVRMAHLEALEELEKTLVPKAVRASEPVLPTQPQPRLVPAPPPPAPPPPMQMQQRSAAGTWDSGAFIALLMKKRPLLGALLCHAEFRQEPGKRIVLAFPQDSFYERQARDTKNRADIEEQLKGFLGPDATLVLASGQADTLKSVEKVRQDETARLTKEALEHPSVIQMKEALGAQVVGVNVEV